MSKPKIYGTCPAGCLWETVHKEDFEKTASLIKQYPEEDKFGNSETLRYYFEKGKEYKIVCAKTANADGSYTFARVIFDTGNQSSGYNLNTADKYADAIVFRYLDSYKGADGLCHLVYEMGGVRYDAADENISPDAPAYTTITVFIKAADGLTVFLYNADATIKAEKGDKGDKGDLQLGETDGTAYEGSKGATLYDSLSEHDLLVRDFPVEIGALSIGEGLKTEEQAWNYNDTYAALKRVRLKQGYTLKLKKGDIFGLTDYTDARFYIGYRGAFGDGLYLRGNGWYTTDFTAPIDGEYIFLLSNITEKVQTSADDLGKLAFVKKAYKVENFKCPKAEPQKIKAINHRGYNSIAPENTLPAFKLSKKNGFDYVECDVSFTSDGVPVLLHEDRINGVARNADGTRISDTIYINDITYEQALTYDFGIWKSADYAGTKIPTFEEFIALCRNIGLHPYIEVKTALTNEQARTLVDIVKSYGMLDGVTWISFFPASLTYIVDTYKYARIGFLSYNVPNYEGNWMYMCKLKTGYNEVFYNVRYDAITNEVISNCKKFGIPLETWCPETEEIITACDPYISGFTTDILNAQKVLYDANIE